MNSYFPGGDPYMGQPKVVNAKHYLAGGQQFGPFTSRNLTLEQGLLAGHTFAEFRTILRIGKDYDHAHPLISPLLQMMLWPTYQSMTDHDIQAIYKYPERDAASDSRTLSAFERQFVTELDQDGSERVSEWSKAIAARLPCLHQPCGTGNGLRSRNCTWCQYG